MTVETFSGSEAINSSWIQESTGFRYSYVSIKRATRSWSPRWSNTLPSGGSPSSRNKTRSMASGDAGVVRPSILIVGTPRSRASRIRHSIRVDLPMPPGP